MIDACGLSCPIPVVKVQRAVKKQNPDFLEVLVDELCAAENVTRFAENHGYRVTRIDAKGGILLQLDKLK